MIFLFCLLALLSFLFLLVGGLIYLWIFLLFSTVMTCFVLNKESSFFSLKYFVFQEFFSGLGVFLLFVFNEWLFLMFCLYMKLALPPFHSWFLKIMYLVSDLSWFMTFSKWAPMMVLGVYSLSSMILVISLMGVSCFFLLETMSFKNVMFYSSSVNIFWGFLISFFDCVVSLLFIFMYFFLSYFIFLASHVSNLDFLLLLGLPPSFFFFSKIVFVLFMKNSVVLLFFLITTVLLFLKYLYVLSLNVLFRELVVSNNNFLISLVSIFLVFLLF